MKSHKDIKAVDLVEIIMREVAKNPYSEKVLKEIGRTDFVEFIHRKQSEKKDGLSKKTIQNNCSHIATFFKELGIGNTAFSDSREATVRIFEEIEKAQPQPKFCRETIEAVLNFFDKGKQKSLQDMCMFYLFACTGIKRSAVLKIRWSDYCQRDRTLTIGGRGIPLSRDFSEALAQLKREAENKTGPIFTLKYRETKAVTASGVTSLFQRINAEGGEFEGFSAQYMRTSIVPFLFNAGYSLEEISYLTNIDARNFLNYISKDEIKQVGQTRLYKNLKENGHPFEGLLRSHLKSG